MIQGDIYWVKFKEPNKERPVLILTRSNLIPDLNSVIVAEITTVVRNNKAELWLEPLEGMPENCVVNFVNLHTIHKSRIGKYITHLDPERLREVRDAISFVFNFEKM